MKRLLITLTLLLCCGCALGAQSTDYDLADQPGVSFLSELNSILAAAQSLNSGATAPANPVAYMLWADTATGYLKVRNAANSDWITGPRLSDMQAPDAAKLGGSLPSAYQTTANMTTAATASKGVLRDGSGRAKVAAPSASDDIAIRSTVDTHANLTAPHSATSAATASRLVLRDANGRTKFTAGAAAGDALVYGQAGIAADDSMLWQGKGYLDFSTTYDPPSLGSTACAPAQTVTASGVARGDFVVGSYDYATNSGGVIFARVSTTGQIVYSFCNYAGSTVDFPSIPIYFRVFRR